jgi:hypothetical protein
MMKMRYASAQRLSDGGTVLVYELIFQTVLDENGKRKAKIKSKFMIESYGSENMCT